MRDQQFPYGKPDSRNWPITVVLTKDNDHRKIVIDQLRIFGAAYHTIGTSVAGIRIDTLLVMDSALDVPNGEDIFNNQWRARTAVGGKIFFVKGDRFDRY